MNPTFSVILPCYNVAPFLKTCLDSIFLNNMEGNELILINDGSTDSFLPFCCNYFSFPDESDCFEKDYFGCNVIIINQTNRGVSESRNRGINAASCDYCLFVDPDDTVSEDWLSNITSTLAREDFDMLLFGYLELKTDAQGNIISTQSVLPLDAYCIHSREEAIAQLLPRYIGRSVQNVKSWAESGSFLPPMEHHSVWRIAYKRSFLMEHHLLFPSQIVLNEDGIFNSNCISNATHIATVMLPLYHYHLRPSGAYHRSARVGKRMVDNKIQLLDERVRLLKRLKQEKFNVGLSMIAGGTVLSIFEMLLHAPDQYHRIKSEYITKTVVSEIVRKMPYVHKLTFDVPLFLLKHRLYPLVRLLFFLARPLKGALDNRS